MKNTLKVVLAIIGLAFSLQPGLALAQDADSASSTYRVLPGDVLQISVWKEPDLQQEVLVRPDAAFSFPLAGDISTENRSVVDLQQEVASRLGRYISNPVVTIAVKEVLGNKVYVIGQVNRPGAIVVNPQIDVMQALSEAGGFNEFAKKDKIKILRRSNGRQVALRFEYDRVSDGRDLSQNIMLQSGDTIVVP